MSESCGQCQWYFKEECRVLRPYFDEASGKGVWPKVSETDWCGEFLRKPPNKFHRRLLDQ